MKPFHWIIVALGVIVLVVGCYVGWDYVFGRQLGPAELAERALSAAGDSQERVHAVTKLTMLPDRKAVLPELRRVATESTDPDVLAAALHGLVDFYDSESRPLFLKAMENSNKAVCIEGYEGLLAMHGGELPNGLDYDVNDSLSTRAGVVRKLKEYYEKADPMKKTKS